MVKPTLAALPPNERILKVVQANPGIHFRGLMREADVTSPGHLQHWIDDLMRKGLIVSMKEGRFTRFFTGRTKDAVPTNLAFLRPVPNRIGLLLKQGAKTRAELRKRLDLSETALGYHLTHLHEAGLIDNDEGVWKLRNPRQPIPKVGWDE